MFSFFPLKFVSFFFGLVLNNKYRRFQFSFFGFKVFSCLMWDFRLYVFVSVFY